MSHIKRMNISEFRSEGYLQEVNRQFFHPLGLALEVMVDKDGNERISSVWDFREEPGGMYYAEDVLDPAKTNRIREFVDERMKPRFDILGYWLQPVARDED